MKDAIIKLNDVATLEFQGGPGIVRIKIKGMPMQSRINSYPPTFQEVEDYVEDYGFHIMEELSHNDSLIKFGFLQEKQINEIKEALGK